MQNAPIFKKTKSGFSFFCFKSGTEYLMITVASLPGTCRYAYDKVTAPDYRVKRVMETDDMVDSNEAEFKAACLAYTEFNDKLKINLSK
jgi:hypothetical protein